MRAPYLAILVFSVLAGMTARAQGPYLVRDIHPSGDGTSLVYADMAEAGGDLFFAADDNNGGLELWKSDGTFGGTVLVRDINAGPDPSNPDGLTVFNDQVFFRADDGATGIELWVSDGSPENTVLVKDIRPGGSGSQPREFTAAGGTLFFAASNGTTGEELWKTDGTPPGTVLVKDINPGTTSSLPGAPLVYSPQDPSPFDGELYFSADDGVHGRELWKSDGTTAGTVMVKDINSGAGDSNPGAMAVLDGVLYFDADDGVNGIELWKTDGTTAGTMLVADINSGAGGSFIEHIFAFGGALYFSAYTPATGVELWKSDGTPGGTALVKDIRPGPSGSALDFFVPMGGLFYFSADDGVNGYELWKSDGTTGGTAPFKDLVPGPESSFPAKTAAYAGHLFFEASTGNGSSPDLEPWISDGTTEGTRLLEDIYPGGGLNRSLPIGFVGAGGRMFFTAQDGGAVGRELYAVTVDPPCLINVSSRGFVGNGDRAMIVGFIIGGDEKRVLIRALGPTLDSLGVPGTLNDPQLQIFSGQTQIASNEDWRDAQESEILATGLAPGFNEESAIILELEPGPYTAVVNNANGTGVALIDVFELD